MRPREGIQRGGVFAYKAILRADDVDLVSVVARLCSSTGARRL